MPLDQGDHPFLGKHDRPVTPQSRDQLTLVAANQTI